MDSPEKILCKEYGSQGGEDHLVSLNKSIALYKQSKSELYRLFYNSLLCLETFEGDMHYAYIRVSSVDQHVEHQKEALSASGFEIDKIYLVLSH